MSSLITTLAVILGVLSGAFWLGFILGGAIERNVGRNKLTDLPKCKGCDANECDTWCEVKELIKRDHP